MSQVDFFNSIAEKWDSTITIDENKINKLLSQISIHNGDSVLDVGTGTGVLIPFYKKLNKDGKITGIDISEGMLNVAKRKFINLDNVKFEILDVENEIMEGKFDKIVLYSMFPHLNNMHKNTDKRVSEDRLIDVNKQKELFEK